MRKRIVVILSLTSLLSLSSCSKTIEDPEKDLDHTIGLEDSFEGTDSLIDGGGKKAKVLLLLGQSNMTGCSYQSYLEKGVGKEKFSEYQEGYQNIKTVFCLDNHNYCSEGEFVATGLNCAAGDDRFGPELGIAEKLSGAFPDEEIFFLKYSMSGFSLNYHWLSNFERGEIYNNCLSFVKKYMSSLKNKNYEVLIDAVCWMQGESDTNEYKASRYPENQNRFVSYLRKDLADYTNERGLYFIDAGISDSPYCLPSYPEINKAKREFSDLSPLNIYFPTIEEGLTTMNEPESNPDLGHYDAMSELKLGHLFGDAILSIYRL